MTFHHQLILTIIMVAAPAWGSHFSSVACQPDREIQAAIQNMAAPMKDVQDFNANVAPFLDLRRRYPENLFVHERYQDAVLQHGIEGHLKALAEEYQSLAIQHPNELMYLYLAARSLMGRTTPAAIQRLSEIVTDHPDFAPAHRALAEIFLSGSFQDPGKEKEEQQKLIALCPGTVLASRAGSLQDHSPLLERAERLLGENGDPDQAMEMATRALRDDEWRLQRIRPFDWYTVDFKQAQERELRAEYIRLWALQVRSYRKKSQLDQAEQLLARMEHVSSWEALVALAHLYSETNQQQELGAKLEQMKQFLSEHPEAHRAAQLEELQKVTRNRR